MKDYYSILGLSPQATSAEIENAIKKLRSDIFNCRIEPQALDEIASTLLSAEKRSQYDLALSQSSAPDENKTVKPENDKSEIVPNNAESGITSAGNPNSSQFGGSFLAENNMSSANNAEKLCPNCGVTLDSNSRHCSNCGTRNPYFKEKINWYKLFFIGHIEGTVLSVEKEPEKDSFCMMRFLFGLVICLVFFYFLFLWLSPIYTAASQTIKYAFMAGGGCILLGSLLSAQWMLVLLHVIFGKVYKQIPVRTAIVVDAQSQEHIVKINGEYLLGYIQKQDKVSLWGLVISSTNYPLFGKFIGENKKGYILLKK